MRLKVHDFLRVAAVGGARLLLFGQRRVLRYVGNDKVELVHLVHDLVDINAWVIGGLLEIAVAASVEKYLLTAVLLRVEHVVALLAEADAHEFWCSVLLECGHRALWYTIIQVI